MMKFPVLLFVTLLNLCLASMSYAIDDEAPTCIQTEDGACVLFPSVIGNTVTGESVTLPDVFAGEYNIVIVPFDREQQEAVIDWLPLMRDIKAEYDWLSYYSVGALPDLPAGVRLLISGGMLLFLEADIREVSILLYLDNQAEFAESLSVTGLDETQLFILNADHEVIWTAQGSYSDELADDLRDQIMTLNLERE